MKRVFKVKSWNIVLGLFFSFSFIFKGCFFGYYDSTGGLTTISDYGDLEVRWLFDGQAACPPDVVDVDVELFNGGSSFKVVTVQCEEGRVIISKLPVDNYTVVVRGVDSTDEITWESDPADVFIKGDSTAVLEVNLTPQ